MNNKIKHLEMIENVVNRMAKNSFMLKGWAVTLVAGIIAIIAKQEIQYWIVALIPLISFWALDSYYLAIERAYRALFEQVRLKKEESIDFALKVKVDVNVTLRTAFSISEIAFYGSLLLGIIVVGLICKLAV